jgi:hypothetical protein
MISLASKATLLSVVGIMIAGAALAGVPNSGNSNINLSGGGAGILWVGGKAGSVVDVHCEKQILVRDAALNPVANSVVIINFTACYGGEIKLGDATAQSFNTTVNCGAHTISATTNASGVAVFRVVGGSNAATPSSAGIGEGCATVTADGVPLGSYSVATPDYTLGGNVGGPDLLYFNYGLFNSGTGGYRSRYNFVAPTGSGIGGPDLIAFNSFLFGAGSTSTTVTYCP